MRQQNKILYVFSRREWLLLAAVVCLCLGIGIWLFFGNVEIITITRGVLSAHNSCEIMHQPYSGYVTDIYVKKNSYVKKGERLISVYRENDSKHTASLAEMKAKSVDIIADFSGYILDIYVAKWDKISVETNVLSITKWDKNKIDSVLAVVDRVTAEKIKAGKTKARLYVRGIPESVYGYATGTVAEMSNVPVGREDIFKEVGTQIGTSYLMGKERDMFYAYIKLDMDKDTHMLKCSKKNAALDVAPNSEVFVVLVVSQSVPYQRIFLREK